MTDPIPPAPNSGAAPASASISGPGAFRPDNDRRRRKRALISVPIRFRCTDLLSDGPDEVSTTIDVSRFGFLVVTNSPSCARGMTVQVTFPYSKAPGALQAEQPGHIVRIVELSDGRRAIAIALDKGPTSESRDCPASLSPANAEESATLPLVTEPRPEPKPLILVLDSEPTLLEAVKTLLTNDGYEVIAVTNTRDAYEVLKLFTPAMIIAEIEGDGLPGYNLCAHVKGAPRLRSIPVVLTTKMGYPSDYSGAHALGAVVCMAKPFKHSRLLHVARLLVPPRTRETQDES